MEEKKEIKNKAVKNIDVMSKKLESLFTEKELMKLTKEEKIEYSEAFKYLDKWLESLFLSKRKRKSNSKQERAILDGFIDNNFEINEKGNLVYHFVEPIKSEEGEIILEKMTYKQRFTVDDQERGTEGVDPENGTAMVKAYLHILTGINRGLIGRMNAVDFSAAGNVCVYFL